MTGTHTTGRLHAFTGYAEHELRDENDKTMAVLQGRPVADARRLSACWNACQGISTEELADIANTGGMLGPREDIARIATQRDTLLTAARVAVLALAHSATGNSLYMAEYEMLSTAINKVTLEVAE